MSERVLRPGDRIGQFVIDKNLGTGSFASVWQCHHVFAPETPVAIKVIMKTSITTPVAQTRLTREICLLKKMEHPFIAQFFQEFQDDQAWYLVMEHVAQGNLLCYVNDNGTFGEDQARRCFSQIVAVLEYLHKTERVMHRDLKAENILLDKYNNVRVIDFGLANVFADSNEKLQTACGSPAYACPQLIRGSPYTTGADIWSGGVLLFAITAGVLPFDDENVQSLLRKILYTEPVYPTFMSPALVDLLKKMLCKSEEERITLEGIKNHPWFSLCEYQALLSESNYAEVRFTGGGEQGLDKEIVGRMAAAGVNCSELHRSLLNREFTDLTALYAIFLREKLVERMKELQQEVQKKAMEMKSKPAPGMRPGMPGAPGAAPKMLTMPQTVGGRRESKPQAVRRPVVIAQTGGHEV